MSPCVDSLLTWSVLAARLKQGFEVADKEAEQKSFKMIKTDPIRYTKS